MASDGGIGTWIHRSAEILLTGGVACLSFQLLARAMPRRGVRRPLHQRFRCTLPGFVVRALPVIGVTLSISPAAAARSRSAVPPFRTLLAPAAPWSRLGGSPPLPLGRAQGPLMAPDLKPVPGGRQTSPPRGHPAVVHARGTSLSATLRSVGSAGARAAGSSQLLFPRARRANARPRPARDRRGSRLRCKCHVVLPGENLWEIAARTLRTDDVGRISHYWRRLYSHNRQVIGPNPNLIRPGEVIELPEQ